MVSLVAQMVKNHLQCRRLGFNPWVGKIPWRRGSLTDFLIKKFLPECAVLGGGYFVNVIFQPFPCILKF